jgi:hypothetical protein
MGSTGYRFVRYYTREPRYRAKGPPQIALRMIAPIVVLTTVLVFVSGVWLMFEGPRHRNPLLEIHKVSFIVWVVFMALHVLGHLAGLGHGLQAARPTDGLAAESPGSAGRWLAVSGVMVAGVVLALVLIPRYAPWTAPGALHHHHHH